MKDRDYKIVSLIAEGYSAKQIGDVLDLSHRTIEQLIGAIKKTFGAESQAHLIAILFKEGILK